MKREHAYKLREMMHKAAISLDDEDALSAVELFPAWKANTEYKVNDRVHWYDRLFRCVQAHTSEAYWEPPMVPALWTEVSVDEWPEWKQPTGAQDAYNKGDKVTHNEKHYISSIDSNVWEPGVYGWEEQV